MPQITVNLPDYVAEMPEQERDLLIRAGLHQATLARRQQLVKDLAEAKAQISEFERKYGRSFEQFEADILPVAVDFDIHSDYNDWFYLSQVVERLLISLSGINGIPMVATRPMAWFPHTSAR